MQNEVINQPQSVGVPYSLQTTLPGRNIGLSGRFTYSYDDRYFAEFDFGYNGSERFYKTNRFGFFPSAGVAWHVSNEKFWESLQNTVTNLKRSEEHTSELQSLMRISYAVFCLKKKKNKITIQKNPHIYYNN